MGGYIGARAGTISATVANVPTVNAQDITATDTTPEVTIVNSTHEDSDLGREGKVIFKGQQSGGEESTLAEIEAHHHGSSDDEKGSLVIRTNDGSDGVSPTEAMRIQSDQKVGINNSSPSATLDIVAPTNTEPMKIKATTDGYNYISHKNAAGTDVAYTGLGGGAAVTTGAVTDYAIRAVGNLLLGAGANAERARIDSSGNLLVGHTSQDTPVDNGGAGVTLRPTGTMLIGGTGTSIYANREDSNGEIMQFRKDGTSVGGIGCVNRMYMAGTNMGIYFGPSYLAATNSSGAIVDDTYDIGDSSYRWGTIYAATGSIQTSDENEKQDIASLTNAEITAATAISKLFKTFKWKSKVTAKGDNARTHTGVIAQQVQTVMSDAGLDASKYAFWCSDTWWQVDGGEVYNTKDEAPEGATEHTRMGIRYAELLAFIGAATEQRLTSIEARLTALEAE